MATIKRVGAGAPVTETAPTKEGGKAEGAKFSSSVSPARGAAPSGSAALVDLAVADVAAEVRRGGLPDGEARVDAVIARMVEREHGTRLAPAALRARVEETQLALGDHPGFAARVHALIDDALAAIDE